ncbi:MAG: Gfo/Idh/MocA family oxidoreductase [Planctomycetes bacterium]|nr:Gfo/Idh/MocA family oxidoreductase [Planctomycetota bacterium]
MDTSRRSFLAASAASAAALGNVGQVLGANERVGVAVIGVNGMGHFHVRTLAARKDVRIVALCDVDAAPLARAVKTVQNANVPAPAAVEHFRRVLDNKEVQAVVIATPHHWHCPIALRALAAEKHVYVEKPASHVFREGRLLIEAAQKHRRVVQHGTQMRSSPVTFRAGEVLASGVLGTIKITKAWNVQRTASAKPIADSDVPKGVNYDLWLGPAPRRPFNRHRFHGSWRLFRDYGNGDIGDDGIHDIDMARWGLGETSHPVKITAHGNRTDPDLGPREYPDNMIVTYEYASGKVLIYEDRQFTPYGLHGFDSGNAFYGTRGYMIFSRRGYFQVYLGEKEERGPGMGERGRVGQPAPAHMENFLTCIRNGREPNASAEVAHLSSSLVHLGEIAYRTGKVLRFDPKTESFVGEREANGLLSKEYRKPWDVATG